MSKSVKRRKVLKSSAAAVVWLAGKALASEPCDTTAERGRGPFYPVRPIPHVVDLTAENGGKAHGRIVSVQGKVLDKHCKPIPDMKVEIWQADPDGRYDHPGQQNEEPLDPHFAYFGFAKTDPEGVYKFRTVIPGPYRFGNLTRAPHIHFSLKHPDYKTHVTELYFSKDSEFQDEDPVFQGIAKNKRATVVMALQPSNSQAKTFQIGFDIHLT